MTGLITATVFAVDITIITCVITTGRGQSSRLRHWPYNVRCLGSFPDVADRNSREQVSLSFNLVGSENHFKTIWFVFTGRKRTTLDWNTAWQWPPNKVQTYHQSGLLPSYWSRELTRMTRFTICCHNSGFHNNRELWCN